MFSQKLKELRSERGLTQKQIAEQLNMSQQGYARWESGKIQPSIPTIEKFANFFNIPIAQLLSEENEKSELELLIAQLNDEQKEQAIQIIKQLLQ